jgi:hypothetical protein
MTHRKDAEPVRTTRESEIFRDPPGSGNYSSSIGAAQGIELFSGSGPARRARPLKLSLSQRAKFRCSPKLTCSSSAVGLPERLPPSLRRGSARTCCWSSAITTWVDFRPAASSSGSTA